MSEILKIEHLSLSFFTPHGEIKAVKDVSLNLNEGEILGIVGESGCGKSVLCKSITKLLPDIAKLTSGRIIADGEDITDYDEKKMCRLRGSFFAYVFQHPMTALNPTLTVGEQITEAIRLHGEGKGNQQNKEKAVRLLELVGIEDAVRRIDSYPHEFSGGMRQRAVIAMALASEPKVILADEPTTALDEHIGTEILKLFDRIRRELGTSIILISHDLDAVRNISDRIMVMYNGSIVESGTTDEIFNNAHHPYTKLLLSALPENADGSDVGDKTGADKQILIDIHNLSHTYHLPQGTSVHALRDVDLSIRQGEIFGIMGESGSGKSTLAKCIMNILSADSGSIVYRGINISDSSAWKKERKNLASSRQLIFQDSTSSLDPRMKVADIIAEPMRIAGIRPWTETKQSAAHNQTKSPTRENKTEQQPMSAPRAADTDKYHENKKSENNVKGIISHNYTYREEALRLMEQVGLEAEYADKYPSELSGGQRQRVSIARALSVRPELVIADEALASLDAPIQMQIAKLFKRKQEEYGFTLIFISHDMRMVDYLCDRAVVIEHGRVVQMLEL